MSFRGQWDSDLVQYNLGDSVEYEGKRFKIIQAHCSQPDWAPTVTPALWQDVRSEDSGGGDATPAYQPSYQAPPPVPSEQPQDKPQQPAPSTGYTTDNGVQVQPHEADKKWYDLDDKKKEELVAGGLVTGLGLLAGGAYYAHEKHKKEGEEEKAQAFELQNWLMAARQRTEQFRQYGPRGPTTWILSEQDSGYTPDMIPAGDSHENQWYIARAPHHGGIHVGKCRPGFGAAIGYGNEAIHVKTFEVLIGDRRAVRWVQAHGRLNPNNLGARPVEGGREADGTPLFVARGFAKEHSGFFGLGGGGEEGLFPGKASIQHNGALVTAGDKEVEIEDYEVLCYA